MNRWAWWAWAWWTWTWPLQTCPWKKEIKKVRLLPGGYYQIRRVRKRDTFLLPYPGPLIGTASELVVIALPI